jgi:hypothetical protein
MPKRVVLSFYLWGWLLMVGPYLRRRHWSRHQLDFSFICLTFNNENGDIFIATSGPEILKRKKTWHATEVKFD